MSDWYTKVTKAREDDFLPLAEAICYYDAQSDEGIRDLTPQGRLWDTAKRIPGLMAYRFTQLQEVEAILDFMTTRANRKHAEHKRRYLETYHKQLSEKAAGDYASIENEVYDLRCLVTHVAMVRNKLLGLTKGLESLHFQMSNLVKLREAGIEDATF